MLDNALGVSTFPLVPHEVVGRVVAVGEGRSPGVDRLSWGLGWIRRQLHTALCLGGDHKEPLRRSRIQRGGRSGGFLPATSKPTKTLWLIPDPAPASTTALARGRCSAEASTVFAPLIRRGRFLRPPNVGP